MERFFYFFKTFHRRKRFLIKGRVVKKELEFSFVNEVNVKKVERVELNGFIRKRFVKIGLTFRLEELSFRRLG